MKLDVNTDSAIQLTAKLEKLSKSAFPSAVRNTLNQCVVDMKNKEILKSAVDNMKVKSSTKKLIKKLIIYDKADGFNVNKMNAVVGLKKSDSNKTINAFIKGLEKQEKGGVFDDGLRYLKGARGGRRPDGKVRLENYYDKENVVSGRSKTKRGRGTKKSKFVARAYYANKSGKMMFMDAMKGNFLVKVKSIKKDNKGKIKMKFDFMMMDRKEKESDVKANNFITEAGFKQAKKIEKIYQEKAEYQFKKYLR